MTAAMLPAPAFHDGGFQTANSPQRPCKAFQYLDAEIAEQPGRLIAFAIDPRRGGDSAKDAIISAVGINAFNTGLSALTAADVELHFWSCPKDQDANRIRLDLMAFLGSMGPGVDIVNVLDLDFSEFTLEPADEGRPLAVFPEQFLRSLKRPKAVAISPEIPKGLSEAEDIRAFGTERYIEIVLRRAEYRDRIDSMTALAGIRPAWHHEFIGDSGTKLHSWVQKWADERSERVNSNAESKMLLAVAREVQRALGTQPQARTKYHSILDQKDSNSPGYARKSKSGDRRHPHNADRRRRAWYTAMGTPKVDLPIDFNTPEHEHRMYKSRAYRGAVRVYNALCLEAYRLGITFADFSKDYGTIAAMLGVTKRTAQIWVEHAEQFGFLTRTDRGAPRRKGAKGVCTTYKLHTLAESNSLGRIAEQQREIDRLIGRPSTEGVEEIVTPAHPERPRVPPKKLRAA